MRGGEAVPASYIAADRKDLMAQEKVGMVGAARRHQPRPGLGMASCMYKVGGLELMIRLNNSHLSRMECFI